MFNRFLLFLVALFLLCARSYAQTTLTGAMLFSTTPTGATNNYAELNTMGGDIINDLWLALNPDASSPINGPSDAQAGISLIRIAEEVPERVDRLIGV